MKEVLELNKDLSMGIIHFQEFNELTPDYRRTLMEMIWQQSDSERYKKPMQNENLKILCESAAYVACSKHAGHCNLDRCKNPHSYVVQIIRSSFADTFCKHGNFKKTRISYEIQST